MWRRNFEPTDKIYWHDKILAKTILRLVPKWVLPNHITFLRFLLTPLVAWLVLVDYYLIGFIAFLLVAFTDVLDGSLARTRNQITAWGRVYDPLADKLLISSMVFVIVLRYIDFWASIMIVGIELIIIITAWIRMKKGIKLQANLWGKIKMFLQVLGVSILLFAIVFDVASLLPLASGTLYLAIAFAIVSLLTYGI